MRARSGQTMAPPFAAPRTAFNASVTPHRNIAYAQLDREDIKKVKDYFRRQGSTDVVMALVSGVLRQFLLDRWAELAGPRRWWRWCRCPCTASRIGWAQPGFRHVRQPQTHIADPVERIKAIADANSVAKQHSSAIKATLLQDWSQFAAPAVFGMAMRAYARTSPHQEAGAQPGDIQRAGSAGAAVLHGQ